MGRERSGTTLLQSLLNSHSHLVVPEESPFIKWLYSRYRRGSFDAQRGMAFYHDLLREPYFSTWHIDREALKAALPACQSFSDCCKAVYHQYAIEQGKAPKMMGDKNPQYSLFCKELSSTFPHAKFIWVSRNPYAQVNSMLRVNFEKKVVSSLAYRWKRYNRTIQQFAQQHPTQVLHIKHEDLVADTPAVLQRICTFLDVDYDAGMLEKRSTTVATNPQLVKEHHQHLTADITAGVNDAWHDGLSEKEVSIIHAITGDFGQTLGYNPEGKKAGVGTMLSCVFGLLYGRLYFPFLKFMDALPLGWRFAFFKRFIAPNFKFWQEAKARQQK